jgi:hypothetical protein
MRPSGKHDFDSGRHVAHMHTREGTAQQHAHNGAHAHMHATKQLRNANTRPEIETHTNTQMQQTQQHMHPQLYKHTHVCLCNRIAYAHVCTHTGMHECMPACTHAHTQQTHVGPSASGRESACLGPVNIGPTCIGAKIASPNSRILFDGYAIGRRLSGSYPLQSYYQGRPSIHHKGNPTAHCIWTVGIAVGHRGRPPFRHAHHTLTHFGPLGMWILRLCCIEGRSAMRKAASAQREVWSRHERCRSGVEPYPFFSHHHRLELFLH